MFQGLYTAIVTPFDKNGNLNEAKLREHIKFQADNGVDGIVPAGTTGENPTFKDNDYDRIFNICAEEAKEHNIKVIAGCGSNDTRKAIDLCKKASEAGCHGALVITPYYNKPNQKGLLAHFTKVADESPLPVVMYNVPSRTSVNIDVETAVRLSSHDNIVALKEASASLMQVQDIIDGCDGKMDILSGEDALTYSIMAVGGKGVICVTSNIVPKEMKELVDAMLNKDFEKGLELQMKLKDLSKALFCDVNPVPVKAALNLMGKGVGEVRLPLVSVGSSKLKELELVLRNYGLIK